MSEDNQSSNLRRDNAARKRRSNRNSINSKSESSNTDSATSSSNSNSNSNSTGKTKKNTSNKGNSSASSATTKGKRRIKFAKRVQTRECIHVNDMNETEIAACWFLPDECQPTFRGDDKDCFRGLEQMTREGMAKQIRNTRTSIEAVLREQARQRFKGVINEATIASVYVQKSRHCRTEARKWGVLDAHDAGIPIDEVVASIKEQKERNSRRKAKGAQDEERDEQSSGDKAPKTAGTKKSKRLSREEEEEEEEEEAKGHKEDYDDDDDDDCSGGSDTKTVDDDESFEREQEQQRTSGSAAAAAAAALAMTITGDVGMSDDDDYTFNSQSEDPADDKPFVRRFARRGRRGSLGEKVSLLPADKIRSSSSGRKNKNKSTSTKTTTNTGKSKNIFKLLVRRATGKEPRSSKPVLTAAEKRKKFEVSGSSSTLGMSDKSLETQ